MTPHDLRRSLTAAASALLLACVALTAAVGPGVSLEAAPLEVAAVAVQAHG